MIGMKFGKKPLGVEVVVNMTMRSSRSIVYTLQIDQIGGHLFVCVKKCTKKGLKLAVREFQKTWSRVPGTRTDRTELSQVW